MKWWQNKTLLYTMLVVRPVLNWTLNLLWYIPFYGLRVLLSKKWRERYYTNKASFDDVKTLEELNAWFRDRNKYKYKWDGPYGVLDHTNIKYEFFQEGGDCEDITIYAHEKLKELGYNVTLIYMVGVEPFSFHFDVLIKEETGYSLFNYGYTVKGDTEEDTFKNFSEMWSLFNPIVYIKWGKLY